MNVKLYVVLGVISVLSVGASGQCAKPEMKLAWDTSRQQFSCVASSGSGGSSHDDVVAPKGTKEFCSTARENLLKACPASDEGKACKNKAKSIFNACYRDLKAQDESQAGSGLTTNPAPKTDRAVCMQAFNQQQQVCQARKLPPPSPGQPYVPDTCLQDAIKAQDKCLANGR
jgi:hypothetical protein